jgi:hypothetical protein
MAIRLMLAIPVYFRDAIETGRDRTRSGGNPAAPMTDRSSPRGQHRTVCCRCHAARNERGAPGWEAKHDREASAAGDQICIGVYCEHVLDHHGDLADIARAIGEQENVSLVGGEWHDDKFGGAVPRRPSSTAALAD